MGLWSAYFLVKFLLFAHGDLNFDPWLNLLLAAFTALPASNVRQRFAKNVVAIPASLVLLYHDSYLPPITRLVSAWHAASGADLWAHLSQSVTWKLCAEMIVMLLAYGILRRKLRISTFVFIAIVGLGIAPNLGRFPVLEGASAASLAARGAAAPSIDALAPRAFATADPAPGVAVAGAAAPGAPAPEAAALDERLANFYAEQQSRQVRFPRAAEDGVPFDILVLQVAALSWDDLRLLNRMHDPLLGRFDILLSHFNAAASYDAPAAIRLLRGACGQTPEKQLYDPANRDCSTIEGLRNAGFAPQWLMNYDPQRDGMSGTLRDLEAAAAPAEEHLAAHAMWHSASGAPIYDDYSVLSDWWAKRQSEPKARIALYYNSITLRDGNRAVSTPGVATPGIAPYDVRLSQLFNDINRFLDDVQRSGRHAVVIFMAAEGAALRGDQRQPPGLREIPTSAIASVPVGIAFINASRSPLTPQLQVEAPLSYQAVDELLARSIADDPFDRGTLRPEAYTQDLPQTDFVAENNGITVVRSGDQDMVRSPDGLWSRLDAAPVRYR
jgi:cellulose synthase operon protein YhjU